MLKATGRAGWRRAHQLADRIDRSLGPALRFHPAAARAWTGLLDAVVTRQSDRLYMRKTILPALVTAAPRRILFVGVRAYTRAYPKAFRGIATEFWTADIDPAVAPHGSASRHVTEDLRSIDAAFPPDFFDVVMLNGVFGWGVDRAEDMERALAAVGAVLEAGGALLLGWNSDRVGEPGELAGMASFELAGFAGLPQRQDFADVTHVYAWFRKR